MIYFAATSPGRSGDDAFFKIDSSSGTVTDYGIVSDGSLLFKVVLLSDNSRVFFNDDGGLFAVDTGTDAVIWSLNGAAYNSGDYELALAADQGTLTAGNYSYYTNLNPESYLTLNDNESVAAQFVYGAQLSGNGALLFQPEVDGIDVFDGRQGKLLSRIALPLKLSQNYDALVGDGKDNILIAITGTTGTGVAIVDLSSVNDPAPLPYELSALSELEPHFSSRPVSFKGRPHQTLPSPRIWRHFRVRHAENRLPVPANRPGIMRVKNRR